MRPTLSTLLVILCLSALRTPEYLLQKLSISLSPIQNQSSLICMKNKLTVMKTSLVKPLCGATAVQSKIETYKHVLVRSRNVSYNLQQFPLHHTIMGIGLFGLVCMTCCCKSITRFCMFLVQHQDCLNLYLVKSNQKIPNITGTFTAAPFALDPGLKHHREA